MTPRMPDGLTESRRLAADMAIMLALATQRRSGSLARFDGADYLDIDINLLDTDLPIIRLNPPPQAWPPRLDQTVAIVREEGPFLARITTLSRQSARSRFGQAGPRCLLYERAWIDASTGSATTELDLAIRVDGQWICRPPRPPPSRGPRRELLLRSRTGLGPVDSDNIQVALGLAEARPIRWRVFLGEIPRIALDTDPEGARRFFDDRGAGMESDRLPALIHWVERHRRLLPSRASSIEVRRHLRGRYAFIWHGLAAEIQPALWELEDLWARGLARHLLPLRAQLAPEGAP